MLFRNKLSADIYLPPSTHNDIIFFPKYHKNMVGVAQLVRAPVCGTGGRGFNPLRPPHFSEVLLSSPKVLVKIHQV